MSEEFTKEVKKLDVRVEEFCRREKEFVHQLHEYVRSLKEFDEAIDGQGGYGDMSIDRIMELKSKTYHSFQRLMRSWSECDHERSHLLESFGGVLTSMEESLR
ncbi:MAG: hypothetical protein ACLFUV_08665 [Methanomassiliicoccales archaeon]